MDLPLRPLRLRMGAWVLALLGLLLPVAGLAESSARAVLSLRLNQTIRQDIFPVLREDDVLVSLEDLAQAQVDVPRLGGSRETIDGQVYVPLRSLAPEVSYTLDVSQAVLVLTVPPRLLPVTRVDLGKAPQAMEPSSEASAFLNYGAQLRDTQLVLTAEAAAGVGEVLLSSTAFWSAGHRPVRGLTQFTIDKTGPMVRTVLGDDQINGGLLGGSALLGGVHFSRNFELNPSFVQTPSYYLQGSATTPSSVDVYVNGNRVRQLTLPPGPFELANLPLVQGEAGAQYVLRDAFGREQQVSMNQYVPGGLLAEGLSAFRVALGLRRLNLATESFHYGAPAALGVYRQGLGQKVTGSVRLEASRSLVSGGTSLTLGLPIGELELALAGSVANHQAGAAGSAAYLYLARKLSLQAFARVMSPRYATLALEPTRDRLLLNTGATVGVPLHRDLQVSAEVATWNFRDLGSSVDGKVSGSLRLSERAQLNLSVGATLKNAHMAYTGMASVSVQLAPRLSGNVAGLQRPDGRSATFALSRSLAGETGLGLQARGEVSAHPWGAASASYRGAYGLGSAGLSWHEGRLATEASLAGSIATVGGRVVLSRPVGQGFALVQVPGLQGARVFLNNREVATTSQDGTVLIPNLRAFAGNRLSISAQDIPADFGVPTLEQLVAPASRRGTLVRFMSRRIRPLRGTLALDGEDFRVLAFGEVTLRVGPDVFRSPIGSQGEFELESVPPGIHEASVAYSGGTCLARLVVPNTEQLLIHLERVVCSAQSPREP